MRNSSRAMAAWPARIDRKSSARTTRQVTASSATTVAARGVGSSSIAVSSPIRSPGPRRLSTASVPVGDDATTLARPSVISTTKLPGSPATRMVSPAR